jgi:hypothetical protein
MTTMVPPTGVAFAEGVSAQAVSRRVRRYAERHGLQVKRTETGRIRCFDLEQYKKLESKFRDPARDHLADQARSAWLLFLVRANVDLVPTAAAFGADHARAEGWRLGVGGITGHIDQRGVLHAAIPFVDLPAPDNGTMSAYSCDLGHAQSTCSPPVQPPVQRACGPPPCL